MNEISTTLADRINESHQQAQQYAKRAIEHAFECGEALSEAKAQCKHGEWLSWLKANTGMPERTAQDYMRVAKGRIELESKNADPAYLTIGGALELLKKPTVPESDNHGTSRYDAMVVSIDEMSKVDIEAIDDLPMLAKIAANRGAEIMCAKVRIRAERNANLLLKLL